MEKKNKVNEELDATPIVEQPQNCFELINKYGTYNIQPTSDSGNMYPAIAQGYPKNANNLVEFPEASGNIHVTRRAAEKGDKSAQKKLKSQE